MEFTDRELGTVLAALRLWQRALPHASIPVEIWEIAADAGEALGTSDIDGLCERLNVTRYGHTKNATAGLVGSGEGGDA